MKPSVGFIGLGIMGQPMSRNIVKAGYDLMVYNRTVEKTKPLAEAGAAVASCPREVAQWSDVLILILSGPEAVEEILQGDQGVLAGLRAGKMLINMGTVPPAFSRRLSEQLASHSISAIDAPVSGSRDKAEEGGLVILAGGPQEKVGELEPILLTMGKKVVYCGGAGQGSSMKMAVNLLLGIMAAGLCEAVNLGQRCGLSTETLLETILAGPVGCNLFNLKKELLIADRFAAQFPLKHMTKDLRFVLQTADDRGAALPIGHTVFQLYRHSMGRGLADRDFAAVKKVLEEMSDG